MHKVEVKNRNEGISRKEMTEEERRIGGLAEGCRKAWLYCGFDKGLVTCFLDPSRDIVEFLIDLILFENLTYQLTVLSAVYKHFNKKIPKLP